MAGVVAAVVAVAVVVALLVAGDDDARPLPTAAGADESASTQPSAGADAATPGGTPTSPGDGDDADGATTPGADDPTSAPDVDASQTSAPTPTPTSGATSPTEAPSVAVVDLVTGLSQVLASAPPETGAEPGTLDLGTVDERAVGAALGEAQAQVAEYQDQGWRQVGVPRVVWVRGQRALDRAGTAVRVRACLDSTDVRVVDSAGRDVPGTAGSRSVNLLDLVAVGATWKVSARSFPDEAAC